MFSCHMGPVITGHQLRASSTMLIYTTGLKILVPGYREKNLIHMTSNFHYITSTCSLVSCALVTCAGKHEERESSDDKKGKGKGSVFRCSMFLQNCFQVCHQQNSHGFRLFVCFLRGWSQPHSRSTYMLHVYVYIYNYICICIYTLRILRKGLDDLPAKQTKGFKSSTLAPTIPFLVGKLKRKNSKMVLKLVG